MCIHVSVYNTYTCGPLDAWNHVGFSLLSILKWINKNIVLKKSANIRCFYLMNICHCHTNTTAQRFGAQKLWCRWGTRYLWLNYLDLTACSFLNKVPVWKREDFASVTISWQRSVLPSAVMARDGKEKRERAALTFTKLMAISKSSDHPDTEPLQQEDFCPSIPECNTVGWDTRTSDWDMRSSLWFLI